MVLQGGFGDDDDGEGEDGVWPGNEAAVHAFLGVCTQFRLVAHFDGTLQRTGLDYPAAKVGLELAEVEVTPELWDQIRCIEAGVLKADRETGP